jgi:hypothetical protein
LLQDCGRPGEALPLLEKALHRKTYDPDAHFNRAVILLQAGRFEEGWREYEWRLYKSDWRKGYPYRLQMPRWSGEDFSGRTLLIHCEQGLGDSIQFVRYIKPVKARGGTVVLEAPRALKRLFSNLPGVNEIIEFSDSGIAQREFDLHVPLLSIPGILDTTLDTIPAEIPYLEADRERIARYKQRLSGDTLKVGIVWNASGWNRALKKKSCDLSHFLPLASIPGVHLVGLQKHLGDSSNGTTAGSALIPNWGDEFSDFADTAAAIEGLDLILSVDTAVAHLAGAMGKPTWVLLPHVADWRWMLDREDCPWYPSMRLYRQPRRGDWEEVFRRVTRDLKSLIGVPGKFLRTSVGRGTG